MKSKELQEVVLKYTNLKKKFKRQERQKRIYLKCANLIILMKLRRYKKNQKQNAQNLRIELKELGLKLNIVNESLESEEKDWKKYQQLKKEFQYLRNKAIKELAEKNKDYERE